MTKSLTEQFFKATLKAGTYYVLNDDGIVDIDYYGGDNFQWNVIKQVLAPVPRYDIFCALRKMVKNINRREMQLTIAIKALKEYERCENGSYASKALALIKEIDNE